jgi:predicted MFS family arabinose efflux permease
MSMTAVALIIGVLVAFMIKARWVRASGAVACVLFGLVLSATPAGPPVGSVLGDVGDWTWTTLRAM